MKKFINWVTFGRFCKPKEYGLFLFVNGVPIAQLSGGLDESYYNNPQVENVCQKICDKYYVAVNDFPEVDTMLNELGIPMQSDTE
jgi:hypothetical protein